MGPEVTTTNVNSELTKKYQSEKPLRHAYSEFIQEAKRLVWELRQGCTSEKLVELYELIEKVK